ncbi:MAG TPA: zinc dependent phospholipase C family protein [Candidatus Binataceae bacterium]|nr:zinc dependent phospholipase C family protein [Candidatus Binataceae bacterium]
MFTHDARAWDSHTHQLITRLAVETLPSSSLREGLQSHERALEEYSIEADTVLKARYGRSEQIRHYLDLEEFGTDPFSKLSPDFAAMKRRYGDQRLERSGTLPWTIEAYAQAVAADARARDCNALIRDAGYLAHYVGDASMPLHSTRFYDGYTYADRGVHARIEGAADDYVGEIAATARPGLHTVNIDSVWAPVLSEIKDANSHVTEVIDADREVRAAEPRSRAGYDRAIAQRELAMISRQVASAASLLASIWLLEWHNAGNPQVCSEKSG